jgi:hypothetical protein
MIRTFVLVRRANAEYYSTIKDPIDLTQIQEKLHKNEYNTFEEFLDDLELLFNNAKSFYRVSLFVDERDILSLDELSIEKFSRMERCQRTVQVFQFENQCD